LLALAVALPLAVGGCGGCLDQSESEGESEEKAEEREEPLPDFELQRVVRQPSDSTVAAPQCKPGHWGRFSLALKANNFDYLGRLRMTAADPRGQPITFPGTNYALQAERELALAKGRGKRVGLATYQPRVDQVNGKARFELELSAGEGTYRSTVLGFPEIKWMPSYQYDFVAIARTPAMYGYLRTLPALVPPWDKLDSGRPQVHYRVLLPEPKAPLPLPEEGLFWTATAYLLWDDVEPELLRREQRRALLDWLHWGGQLIVSGPDTLDTLRGSFLEPYLAATGEGAWEFSDSDFEAIERHFGFVGKSRHGGRLAGPGRSTGVRLRLHADAQEVPGTGGLVAERRVGRGRVVVSAFRLSGRQFTSWAGADNFWNACLLRRPPRKWNVSQLHAATQVRWADPAANWLDPRLISSVRYFSRDTGRSLADIAPDLPRNRPETADWADAQMLGLDMPKQPPGGGVAAWDEFSPVSQRARQALLDAARVEVPKASFVLWVVAAYLVVLVPLNWAIFQLLGRIEWAWIAAPLISIAWTVLVIRLAQLDVGFARSTTEIAVAEVHDGYPRAHLTRYHALYSSLTTQYRFDSEDDPALVKPFPRVEDPADFRRLPGQQIRTLHYEQGRRNRFDHLAVLSNSTALVHSEQLVTLDGALKLEQTRPGHWELSNGLGRTIREAGVVQKVDEDRVRTAWLGDIRPGVVKAVRFGLPEPASEGPAWFAEYREPAGQLGAETSPGGLSLYPVAELAQAADSLQSGQALLTGWIEEALPGLAVEPAAPQIRRATLLVGHFELDFGPDPESDRNLRADVDRAVRRAGDAPAKESTDR
jgi:hypothetical protein